MRLSALHLSHFRSHRDTRLTLDGRPVALWGPNGAGKTNLIEAISLLSPGRGLRRAAAADLMRRPESLGWRVAADLIGAGATHEVVLRAAQGGSRAVEIDGKAATQAALGSLVRVLWLVPAMDRLWTEGAEARRRFLDRMTLSFLPGHAAASLAYEKAMRERNRLLRDGVQDARWYAALEARMAEEGAAITANRAAALDRMAHAQAHAVTGFPAARLTLTDPEGAGAADAAALAAGRGRDMAAGRSLLGPHRADLDAVWMEKAMPAAQCSTGEQKALLISLVLANARALAEAPGAPPVLLLDEVAAHLDAARRAALYDEICRLGAQAFLTGTEPGLFDALGGRAARLELVEEAGGSRVRG